LTVETALAEASGKMDKAIGVLKDELGGIRTGRATPALLNRIVVDYYGTQVPIQQLASFSVPEPRTLMISPFDKNWPTSWTWGSSARSSWEAGTSGEAGRRRGSIGRGRTTWACSRRS